MEPPYYSDESMELYCGDCREILPNIKVDVVITDPPYGLGTLAGGYGRNGETIANDLDTTVRDEVLALLGHLPQAVFATPRLPEPPGDWDYRLVWDKGRPGLNGGPWRYNHELIFVKGEWIRVSDSSFSILRFSPESSSLISDSHPHRKPIGLMEILVAAAPPGVIVDPFAGSGSTLTAAKRLGRRSVGIELEERYCEQIVSRLAQGSLFAFDV